MSVNHSARSGGIIGIFFPIFFYMKVCYEFLLESPHRGDSKEYTQHIIINIKRKSYIIPNIIMSAAIVFPMDSPGRVAPSVGHLTRKSEVLGSIPGLATYFRLSFR